MWGRRLTSLGFVAVVAIGCRQLLGIAPPVLASGDAGADAIPDGGPCASVSSECVGDVLRTCAAAGAPSVDATCPWGCLASQARCHELVPTGGGVLPGDLTVDPGLGDVDLTGDVVLDGQNGQITTATATLRNSGSGVISGIDYQLHGAIAVFRFHQLRISGALTISGAYATALVALDSIAVDGSIDGRGSCAANTAGPGGGLGGGIGQGGQGAGAGGVATAGGGGGGGGNGTFGGDGGAGGVGGSAFGNTTVTLLSGGGGGAGGNGQLGSTGLGGGGGGGIQLVANTSIKLPGAINAGGCGGHSGQGASDSGGGGGAGGTVVLEAAAVTVTGSIAVNGGGGGACGANVMSQGGSGRPDRVPATGAAGNAFGGSGGAGSTAANPGSSGPSCGGGGGGGIGRIRINTLTGAVTLGSATLSPGPTDPSPAFTQGSAAIQ